MTNPINLTTLHEGKMPKYQIIANSISKDAYPTFYYINPETGEQLEAVKKGNSLYTQDGHHMCDVHATSCPPPEKPKPNRKQRRSKK